MSHDNDNSFTTTLDLAKEELAAAQEVKTPCLTSVADPVDPEDDDIRLLVQDHVVTHEDGTVEEVKSTFAARLFEIILKNLDAKTSDAAAIHNASVAPAAVYNVWASTLPPSSALQSQDAWTDYNKSRLLIASRVKFTALFASVITRLLTNRYGSDNAKKTLKKILKYAPNALIGINFLYTSVCHGIAFAEQMKQRNQQQEFDNDQMTAAFVVTAAVSVMFGLSLAYSQSLRESHWFSKTASLMIFAIAMGNLASNFGRMFTNVRENTLDPLTSSETFNMADPGTAALCLLIAIVLAVKDKISPAQFGRAGRTVATVDNFFYDVGSLLQLDKFYSGTTTAVLEEYIYTALTYASLSGIIYNQHQSNHQVEVKDEKEVPFLDDQPHDVDVPSSPRPKR